MKNMLKKLCAVLVIAMMLLPTLTVNTLAATYIWPLDSDLNYITSYAGNRIHPLTGEKQNHSGIDIRASKGSDVYATASGVAYIGCNWCDHNYGKSKSCGCGGGYGNYVYIVHKNGMVSYYAHLTSVKVSEGQYVSQGERIGTSGSTGSSTGFHLHFELRTSTAKGDRVDPLDYVSIPGDDYTPVIPNENTGGNVSSTFNPNVVDYYTGFVSNTGSSFSSSNVYDTYVPSAPSTSTPVIPEENTGKITISLSAYPGALKKGSSCNLKGTVSADEDLTRVTGSILNASGTAVQTVTVYPDDDELNINKCNINKNLRFGSLGDGSYKLLIEAKSEDGSTAKWEQAFTVGNAQSAPSTGTQSSAVKMDVTHYPTEIKHGSSYSLRGTISSSARISSVRGYILDKNGDEVQSTSESPNAKSVNIKSARVNQKLAFGKLSKGSYTLKIVAVDKDGNSNTWEKAFVVE